MGLISNFFRCPYPLRRDIDVADARLFGSDVLTDLGVGGPQAS
jgi:hypothetical protein